MRLCIARGVRIQELEELVRRALVKEAKASIEESRGDGSVSKISVTTGIHRTEVARLLAGEERPKGKHDVLNRVIGLWSQRRSLLSKDGTPRALTYEGTSSEFALLVASISKEVTHYPILFELERIGAIEYDGALVRLKVAEYLPQGDVEHGLSVLSQDVADLVNAVEGNLSSDSGVSNLHLRTFFDNIDPAKLPEIRAHILKLGIDFHREIRRYLSGFDRDVALDAVEASSAASTKRAKVVLGAFSIGEELKEAKEIKPKKRGRKPCKQE